MNTMHAYFVFENKRVDVWAWQWGFVDSFVEVVHLV